MILFNTIRLFSALSSLYLPICQVFTLSYVYSRPYVYTSVSLFSAVNHSFRRYKDGVWIMISWLFPSIFYFFQASLRLYFFQYVNLVAGAVFHILTNYIYLKYTRHSDLVARSNARAFKNHYCTKIWFCYLQSCNKILHL